LGETVRRLRRGKTQVRVSCAIDGTGVSPHAVRTYFLRRSEQQNGGKKCFRHYWQWLIVVDGKQQILLAQRARQGTLGRPAGLARVGMRRHDSHHCAWWLAEAEFDSEANPLPIRQRWRAQSIIPAQPRRGVPQGTLRGQMYRNFPQKPYGPRAKVETVFSVVNASCRHALPVVAWSCKSDKPSFSDSPTTSTVSGIAPLGEDVNRAT